ncbi:monocarboxylate transporter 14-like [Acanthaster planci]|uniref:Monocarboxylate transporter 14-like n=1 Tax=Acanthaster planci TaxID=133434 RepID=A0A8B7Z801_ACAPL|nr:monocarboxylate transporter 14-like [Acanthaster planci]
MVCLQTRCGWSRWRWVVTFATFGQFFLSLGPLFNFSTLFLSLQEEFHSSAALTGWLGSLSGSLSCLASPLSALLSLKVRHRTVAIFGVVVFCAGLLTTSFVPVPMLGYAFFTFSVLTGVGGNLMTNASIALLLNWFAKGNFSRASALAQTGSSTGMLVFSPMLTAFITRYGWRNALRILSGGILAVGIADCLLLTDPPSTEGYAAGPRETPTEKHELESMVRVGHIGDDGHAEEGGGVARASTDESIETEATISCSELPQMEPQVDTDCRGRLHSFVTDVEVWAWCVSVTLSHFGWAFFDLNFASYLKDIGLGSNQISTVVMCFALGELGSKLVIALIGNRLPFMEVYMLLVSSLLGTVVLGLLTIAKTFGLMIFFAMVSGVLRSGVNAKVFVAAAQLFHDQYGTEWAITMSLVPNGIGYLISSPLAGILYDVTGDYVFSLLVMTTAFVGASSGYLFIAIRRRIRSRGSCFRSQRTLHPTGA